MGYNMGDETREKFNGPCFFPAQSGAFECVIYVYIAYQIVSPGGCGFHRYVLYIALTACARLRQKKKSTFFGFLDQPAKTHLTLLVAHPLQHAHYGMARGSGLT